MVDRRAAGEPQASSRLAGVGRFAWQIAGRLAFTTVNLPASLTSIEEAKPSCLRAKCRNLDKANGIKKLVLDWREAEAAIGPMTTKGCGLAPWEEGKRSKEAIVGTGLRIRQWSQKDYARLGRRHAIWLRLEGELENARRGGVHFDGAEESMARSEGVPVILYLDSTDSGDSLRHLRRSASNRGSPTTWRR